MLFEAWTSSKLLFTSHYTAAGGPAKFTWINLILKSWVNFPWPTKLRFTRPGVCLNTLFMHRTSSESILQITICDSRTVALNCVKPATQFTEKWTVERYWTYGTIQSSDLVIMHFNVANNLNVFKKQQKKNQDLTLALVTCNSNTSSNLKTAQPHKSKSIEHHMEEWGKNDVSRKIFKKYISSTQSWLWGNKVPEIDESDN